MNEVINKPFLRWAGSKLKLLPYLLPYWNDENQRYIEPFMGSAVLFFKVKPKVSILSDINCDLIKTFIAVRDHPRAVYNRLKCLPQNKEFYYKIRTTHIKEDNIVECAVRFIFLNRYCFNGLYRTNAKGQFNVPFSPTGTGTIPSLSEFYGYSNILKNTKLVNKDFQTLLVNEAQKGDFVYLDPPYAVNNRRIFRQYNQQTFGLEDIERLQQTLKMLDKRNVKFVLSYALCKEAKNAFVQWNMRQVYIQRNISGFAKHRRRAAELIISNFICSS